MINLKIKGSSEHAITGSYTVWDQTNLFWRKKNHSYSNNQAMSCGVCQLGFPIHGIK